MQLSLVRFENALAPVWQDQSIYIENHDSRLKPTVRGLPLGAAFSVETAVKPQHNAGEFQQGSRLERPPHFNRDYMNETAYHNQSDREQDPVPYLRVQI